MEKEVKRWLDKAEKDLETAEYNFKGEELEAAALFRQQSVEKALKAAHIHKNKKLAPKTHDVLFLAGEVNLPDKFISKIESLTDIYMETRYPDIEETIKLKEKDVSNFIKATKEVLKWCKKQI